jgi:hypothetical protein
MPLNQYAFYKYYLNSFSLLFIKIINQTFYTGDYLFCSKLLLLRDHKNTKILTALRLKSLPQKYLYVFILEDKEQHISWPN